MRRTARLAVVLAVAATLFALASSAAAANGIFIGMSGGAAGAPTPRAPMPMGPIYGAALDGSGLGEVLHDAQGPGKMAVQGDYLYWVAAATKAVARMRLDGTGVDLHYVDMPAGAQPSSALAVTNRWIFVAYVTGAYPTQVFHIARAGIGGGTPVEIATAPSYVTGLAADDAHVYWTHPNPSTTGGAIGRARLDGSGARQALLATEGFPLDVEVDAAHIYAAITEAVPGRPARGIPVQRSTILRADIDGTHADAAFIDGLDHVSALAVNAGSLYWTTIATPVVAPAPRFLVTGGAVGRADLDGSHVDRSFIAIAPALQVTPFGLAVVSQPALRLRSTSTQGGVGTFHVRVGGPGTLRLVGVRVGPGRSRAARAAVACRARATVAKAGRVAIACRPNAATLAILELRSVRVRVTITFRAADGGTSQVSRVIVLRRANPVTG